ncbi:MAG: hypothetical protein ABI542_02900 [Gemmatimonadota bacterium]
MTRLTTTFGSRLPRAAWVLLVLPLLGLTCPLSEQVDCTLGDPKFAIEVSFHDDVTRVRLTGSTPGMIQDGAYHDSLRASAVDTNGLVAQMAAGRGRRGTYQLTAKREGYQAYSQSGIRVNSYDCGVAPVFLFVYLTPE